MPRCGTCKGTGSVVCRVCGGSGTRWGLVHDSICENCGGSGIVKCPVCNGKGQI